MRRVVFALLSLGFAVTAQAQPGANPTPFQSEIEAFAAADRASPPQPCEILFVGSSSIRMWQSLASEWRRIE